MKFFKKRERIYKFVALIEGNCLGSAGLIAVIGLSLGAQRRRQDQTERPQT